MGHAFVPPTSERSDRLARYPYLGRNFEFLGIGSADDEVQKIYCLNFSSIVSMGNSAGAPALRFTIPRIVSGIVSSLFVEDADRYLEDYLAFDQQEDFEISWRG